MIRDELSKTFLVGEASGRACDYSEIASTHPKGKADAGWAFGTNERATVFFGPRV
jgi:hypothetical protein